MGTLSKAIKAEMRKEGWLNSEIDDFINAKTPSGGKQHFNVDSKVFLAMRRSRVQYVKDLTRAGWNRLEIKEKIAKFHKGKGHDAFFFLKQEYAPHEKLKDFSDAMLRRKSKIRSAITRGLGYNYGRSARNKVVRRRVPPRPTHRAPNIVRRIRRPKQ
jgi:hypothetical protein